MHQTTATVATWGDAIFLALTGALVVLLVGALLAQFAASLVRGASGTARVGDPGLLAGLARAAVLTFAVLIALDQLNIGEAIVTTLFTAAVGMLALAGALAFGLGGREVAARVLEDWYRRRGEFAAAADRLAVAVGDEARPNATGRDTRVA